MIRWRRGRALDFVCSFIPPAGRRQPVVSYASAFFAASRPGSRPRLRRFRRRRGAVSPRGRSVRSRGFVKADRRRSGRGRRSGSVGASRTPASAGARRSAPSRFATRSQAVARPRRSSIRRQSALRPVAGVRSRKGCGVQGPESWRDATTGSERPKLSERRISRVTPGGRAEAVRGRRRRARAPGPRRSRTRRAPRSARAARTRRGGGCASSPARRWRS